VRIASLGVLGVCGVLSFGTAGAPPLALPSELPTTPLALGIAILSILLRHAASGPRRNERGRYRLGVAAVVAAGALGLVGLLHAWRTGEAEEALLFVLAGTIFSLAPMAPAGPRRRPGAEDG